MNDINTVILISQLHVEVDFPSFLGKEVDKKKIQAVLICYFVPGSHSISVININTWNTLF